MGVAGVKARSVRAWSVGSRAGRPPERTTREADAAREPHGESGADAPPLPPRAVSGLRTRAATTASGWSAGAAVATETDCYAEAMPGMGSPCRTEELPVVHRRPSTVRAEAAVHRLFSPLLSSMEFAQCERADNVLKGNRENRERIYTNVKVNSCSFIR